MSTSTNLFENVPRSSFDVPGRSRGLSDVIRWRYLLNLLVRTGVSTRYRNSILGWTWSYVRPAAQFLVFWVVLGLFMNLGDRVPNYPIYLFSGIVIINLFSEAFKNATTSIVNNAPLVRKVFLPRQLFAVSAVVVAFVHFLPQLALLVIVCAILGLFAHMTWLGLLAIIAALVIVMLFALGIGLFFGALNVRYRDSENIVELLLLLATWASPVLYAWTMVQAALKTLDWPGWLLEVYLLNPITHAVELFHYAIWRPVTVTDVAIPPGLGWNTLWTFLIAIAALLIGQFVFQRLEGRFAQDL
ncbi:ABC-2 type transport system permease protein [Microbacterium resistens]|uniref:Transport permease protein n=1 Tax=Microbacterium resistens TaxID=156977 RepID=A0ABU1S9N1_9MICO|nr:ABC transporter permease [Microbacterium resistens]MDR6866300.1 ABC-2 type transport system permease protein [Microbacterium resistens]